MKPGKREFHRVDESKVLQVLCSVQSEAAISHGESMTPVHIAQQTRIGTVLESQFLKL